MSHQLKQTSNSTNVNIDTYDGQVNNEQNVDTFHTTSQEQDADFNLNQDEYDDEDEEYNGDEDEEYNGDEDDNDEDDDEDEDGEEDDDDYFDEAPDSIISSDLLSNEQIQQVSSLEQQVEMYKQQGYQFENPYQDEDDKWYQKFVQGQVDHDVETDDENDPNKLTYSFPIPEDNNNNNVGMNQGDGGDNLIDTTTTTTTTTTMSSLDNNNPLLALPDANGVVTNRDISTPLHTEIENDPLQTPMPISETDKDGLRDMVTKQMLLAAAMHSLELAALDMRIEPRKVNDPNSLDIYERQQNLQRQKIKEQFQSHVQNQEELANEYRRVANQAESEGRDPQFAIEEYKMQKKLQLIDSLDKQESQQLIMDANTPEELLENDEIRKGLEQLQMIEAVKPQLHPGQLELGINVFKIFNPENVFVPYKDILDNNPDVLSRFKYFNSHVSKFIEPNTTYNGYKPLNLIQALSIPTFYTTLNYMPNSIANIKSATFNTTTKPENNDLQTPLPPSHFPSTLPSLTSQLTSMLLMKEAQRSGVIPYQLTLFHLIDCIIRICDDDLYSFTDDDIETFYQHKSQRDQKRANEQIRQHEDALDDLVKIRIIDDDDDDGFTIRRKQDSDNELFDSINTTTSRLENSTNNTTKKKDTTQSNNNLQSGIRTVLEMAQNPTTNPKIRKYTLGREILGSLLAPITSTTQAQTLTPAQIHTQQQNFITDLYLECVLLRQVLLESWKCHVVEYNPDAINMFQVNHESGETPFFVSPLPKTLNHPRNDTNNNDDSRSNHKGVTFLENKTAIPVLPLWMYAISADTMVSMLLIFSLYDTLAELAEKRQNIQHERYVECLEQTQLINHQDKPVGDNNDSNDMDHTHPPENTFVSKLYLKFLNTNPPPKFSVSTINQDYESEKEFYEAHILFIDALKKTKSIIAEYITKNSDDGGANELNLDTIEIPGDVDTFVSTGTNANNMRTNHIISPPTTPHGDVPVDDNDDVDMPLLLTSDWSTVHKSCINAIDEFFLHRFPQLALPTAPLKLPFLVILLLTNDTEEKAALAKRTRLNDLALPVITPPQPTTTKSNNPNGLPTKTLMGKRRAAKNLKGSKRTIALQQSRQEQELTSLEQNVWKESYISTGQDNDDEVNAKKEKSINFLKSQHETAVKLAKTTEYNFEQLRLLFQYDYFYPWEFPFVPKLPPIPCSKTQYNTITNYYHNQLKQWTDTKQQIQDYITQQRQIFKQQLETKSLGISHDPLLLDPSTQKNNKAQLPKPRPKSQAHSAISDLTQSTTQGSQQHDENASNQDQNTEDVQPQGKILHLPQVSTTYAQLPNENFGNLSAEALFKLCQHGSLQYKKHLEQERELVLEARRRKHEEEYGVDAVDAPPAFTEVDLNNLQLFPNQAVDNAYSYVRSKQQRLEERQERRKLRRQQRDLKRANLEKKLINNEAVSLDQHVDTTLANMTTMSSNSSDSSDQSSMSDNDGEINAGGNKIANKLKKQNNNSGGDSSSDQLTDNDPNTSDDDVGKNKSVLTDKSSITSTQRTGAGGGKSYRPLPASMTLLEYETNEVDSATSKSIQMPSMNASTSITMVDPRNISTVTRSGLLILPLLQTIPFVFDSISQLASYSTGAISTKGVQQPADYQSTPLRYINSRWCTDQGVDVKEKTIKLCDGAWHQ